MQFFLTLKKTYWKQAYFNVRISYEKYFGQDEETVRVALIGQPHTSLTASINRRCNKSGQPRLHFKGENRLPYQDWKQANGRQGDQLAVEILGANHIRLSIASSQG